MLAARPSLRPGMCASASPRAVAAAAAAPGASRSLGPDFAAWAGGPRSVQAPSSLGDA